MRQSLRDHRQAQRQEARAADTFGEAIASCSRVSGRISQAVRNRWSMLCEGKVWAFRAVPVELPPAFRVQPDFFVQSPVLGPNCADLPYEFFTGPVPLRAREHPAV